MFKIHNQASVIPENENIFVLYWNNGDYAGIRKSLTLSHIIIDLPQLDQNHLQSNFCNMPNICLIEYKNAYSDAAVFDFDVINCVKYVQDNKIIPIRKSLHYDVGLYEVYKNYIVDRNNLMFEFNLSSYYNVIKYYHSEYLDFKPAFDKIIDIYNKCIETGRTDILEFLGFLDGNDANNGNFIITCDTNTTMYENYINTGKYDLDKSIIFNEINDLNYKNENSEWNAKLHRDKIKYRYDMIIDKNVNVDYNPNTISATSGVI